MVSDSILCTHERWHNDAGLNVYCLDCGLPMGCDIVNACISSRCSPLLRPIGEPWRPCADCIEKAIVARAKARELGGYALDGKYCMPAADGATKAIAEKANAFQIVPVLSSQELVRVIATEREDSASAQPTCVQAAYADGAIEPAYFAAAHKGLESEQEAPMQKIELSITGQHDPSRIAKLVQKELEQLARNPTRSPYVLQSAFTAESVAELTPEWYAKYNGVRR